MTLSILEKLKFRESDPIGYVIVLENDRPVYRNREYRTAAEWAQRTYNLSNNDLLDLYRDYRSEVDDR